MTNRNEMWRLEDEKGERLGEPPSTYQRLVYCDFNSPYSSRIQEYTASLRIRNIEEQIHDEYQRYYAAFARRPEFLTFSKEGYESFVVAMDRTHNLRSIAGATVLLNPSQTRPVMALGSARDELFGGLYDE